MSLILKEMKSSISKFGEMKDGFTQVVFTKTKYSVHLRKGL